jgi:GT2 family glycosyltransferase
LQLKNNDELGNGMVNLLKQIRDFFFPPLSKRREVYDLFRIGWLTLLKKGPKGVYQKAYWRLSKPRRLTALGTKEESRWNKTNLLMDEDFFAQINQPPLTEKVDIIICVGPNQDNIVSCISSVRKFTKESLYNLHVVIHQNDVNKLPVEILPAGVDIVTHCMELFNYSRANNLVLKHCNNDVVLLNDDTEVTEDWLEKLRQDSKAIALTGAHTEIQCSGNPQMWGEGPARLTHFPINMFCAYIPYRIRAVIGLLDEEFCYYGGEDVDYSCRALLNGFPLVISSAFIHHKDNQSYQTTKDLLMKESDRIILEKYGIQSPFDLSKIKPLISVILATRNRPELLISSLPSILNIGYDNFELLLVDDYSSKETNEVIFNFQQKDDRIITIRLPKNVGLSKARSIGLNASQGQFVIYTDDDDTVLPNRITKPLDFIIQNPLLDVVYCNYNLVVSWDNIVPTYNPEFDLQSYLELKFNIGSGILLGRRQAFMDVPFMSIYDQAVDFDWVFRLIRKGYRIDRCPEIVMNYNRTGSMRYHLAGNKTSMDLHDTIYQREILLQKMQRKN